MSIRCGHCKDRHETVTEVKACAAPAARPSATLSAPATEGIYRRDGVIYKVQRAIHGSGRLYAKELVEGRFVMAAGAIKLLSQADRMTTEEAAAWGALYGRCIRCQADLTDEDSIARGMGLVCATKI